MQNKFQVHQLHSIGEKCDAIFSKTVQLRNMKFFCKEYPYGLLYKMNFKFYGRTVSEKNVMLTCKISKLFSRTILQL